MPVVAMQQILQDAFQHRYGVAAFNVVNDLTLRAVLDAAAETRSPVIIQVSVKTARQLGVSFVHAMFSNRASHAPIPTTLHLDHCPDPTLIEECITTGWNSVLFDASHFDYTTNLRETTKVVQLAHQYGVAVEGELEAVRGVEDDQGSNAEGATVPLHLAVAFIRATRIDSFAPAIGTAHGLYRSEPVINYQRAREIVAAEPIPLVLHGGTGLKDDTVRRLVSLGAVKVNISTQLKISYTDGLRNHLSLHPTQHDPTLLHHDVKRQVQAMAAQHMHLVGSAGRAP